MDEIVQYLTGIPAWYLATIDAADPTQPRVRPFSFAAQADGKLWFSTSRDKDVWLELEANAKFELSGWKPGECWIVVEGEAELADDEVCPDEVRQAGFEHMVGCGDIRWCWLGDILCTVGRIVRLPASCQDGCDVCSGCRASIRSNMDSFAFAS